MRLIDADKFFNDMYNMCNTKAQFVRGLGEIVNVVDVLEQIMNTPTIDAVEVVRCKDCKWRRICMKNNIRAEYVTDDDYCSWGERREEGAEMGIQVNDFKYISGDNDAEYIKLLQEHINRLEDIIRRAIAQLKMGCTGCVHYDQQRTDSICHDCKRYHKDMYNG